METPPCIHHIEMSNKGFCVNNISSGPICRPHDRSDGINLDIADQRHLGVYRWPYKLNKFISKRKFMAHHEERIFDTWYIYWASWNVYLPSYIWRNSPRDMSFYSTINIYTLLFEPCVEGTHASTCKGDRTWLRLHTTLSKAQTAEKT